MVGFDEFGHGRLLVVQPDPVALELNRLENLLKEKDRELGFAHSEIKALKATDVLKDKSLDENLDIKKLITEKKEAFAAQFAAEATLRRVHANQTDDNMVPIESIIAPLEADIRMYKNEIAALQEDKKTLERHTKSKEAALLEAERILRSALERALIVEEEENKILEKTNRQKVLEVERLSETIKELEEAILASGATANAIRDYRRQISHLHEEKRTLERELSRAMVSANRVATTVANEWKDENDKVMPVKQWLEERRAEMQRLRDKLMISERTSKSEAQLKEKVKLRLKTLEDGLKQSTCGSPKLDKSNQVFGFLSSHGGRKRSTSQPRGSFTSSQKSDVDSETRRMNSINKQYVSGENFLRKSLWASRSKVADGDEKENNERILENAGGMNLDKFKDDRTTALMGRETVRVGSEERQDKGVGSFTDDDVVSGFLYDRLQKEVISLRKFCEMKESSLNAKEDENKVLMRKFESLIKAHEVESKKLKREAAIRDKNSTFIKTNEQKLVKNLNSSKRAAKAS
ncbi:microtubule-associated protein 70-5 [Tanacetum coccineum]